MRADKHGMESKEYRAPREGEGLEPTPETVAKRRAAAEREQESRPK
jgi:hypothetical protein